MKNIAIRTLYKLISKDFAPRTRLRFWYPSIKFSHEINLKELYLVLSDWGVK